MEQDARDQPHRRLPCRARIPQTARRSQGITRNRARMAPQRRHRIHWQHRCVPSHASLAPLFDHLSFSPTSAGEFGEASHADYAASKSALTHGLQLSLKNEIVRSVHPRARVNTVAPGWVRTQMAEESMRDEAVRYQAMATYVCCALFSLAKIANDISFQYAAEQDCRARRGGDSSRVFGVASGCRAHDWSGCHDPRRHGRYVSLPRISMEY